MIDQTIAALLAGKLVQADAVLDHIEPAASMAFKPVWETTSEYLKFTARWRRLVL